MGRVVSIPFPPQELALIDQTIRMFTEPVLEADVNLLGEIWSNESKRKAALLEALGVGPDDLQSAERFAELLRREGVEPATKPSPTGNGDTYAFAKTDDFMRELAEDGNERVRTLVEARLRVKSTLDQTRAERLGYQACRGRICAYYNYCGTHTTLWSGGDRINFQNFKRSGDLRRALRAPKGYLIAKVDQSQVQCRLVNWLAGQEDVIERFRKREDPYLSVASLCYDRRISTDDKAERGTGKQLELSCGFGSGAATIQRTAKRGTYGPSVEIDLATAERWRDIYRATHPRVVQLWKIANGLLHVMATNGRTTFCDFLPVEGTTMLLPGGLPIHWPQLQWDDTWQSFKFLYGQKRWKRIWGGFLVQNVVSALASCLVREAMLRIRQRGLRIVLQEHDAVGILVLDDCNKDATLERIIDEMRRTPDWAPGLPLDAEGKLGETYQ